MNPTPLHRIPVVAALAVLFFSGGAGSQMPREGETAQPTTRQEVGADLAAARQERMARPPAMAGEALEIELPSMRTPLEQTPPETTDRLTPPDGDDLENRPISRSQLLEDLAEAGLIESADAPQISVGELFEMMDRAAADGSVVLFIEE